MTVIYPVHNRLEYVKLTLPALLDDVRFSGAELLIFDDMSTDGTTEYIKSVIEDEKHIITPIGNSTEQWNLALDLSESEYIAKFDNDILITRGTLDRLQFILSQTDLFGLSPLVAGEFKGSMFPSISDIYKWHEASHIGGIGIFRTGIFRKFGKVVPSIIEGEERFFGFTAYQNEVKKRGYKCAIAEGVKVIELDRSPIYSRLNEYTSKGYGRNIIGKVKSVFNGI